MAGRARGGGKSGRSPNQHAKAKEVPGSIPLTGSFEKCEYIGLLAADFRETVQALGRFLSGWKIAGDRMRRLDPQLGILLLCF
jgi:hypothetical protein